MSKLMKGIFSGYSTLFKKDLHSNVKNIITATLSTDVKKNEASQKQIMQRLKFKVALDFILPIKDLLDITFHNEKKTINHRASAISYLLRNSFENYDNGFALNLSKVLLGIGNLKTLEKPKIKVLQDGLVKLIWKDNSNSENANENDEIVVVFYEPIQAEFQWFSGFYNRKSGEAYMQLSPNYFGKKLHIWAMFVNENATNNSNSNYLNTIDL